MMRGRGGSGSTFSTIKLLSVIIITQILVASNFFPFLLVECSGNSGRGFREWRKNTNFGNYWNNWEGLVDVNCSTNIFSFPQWMDTIVVSWPATIITKQIILPSNGHFVFETGITTLSDEGKSDGSCQRGREVKFRRTTRADWFDPDNWEVTGTDQAFGANAIPHVERVPCQFDAAKFPAKSTFSIVIPQNVALGKFLLGNEVLSYMDIALMMNSNMGKLQWDKKTEIDFNLTNVECKDDEDSCICDNYKASTKQKICSLAQSQCQSLDEEHCTNPLLPHGFCCPICGFHIKIKHSGSLNLNPIASRLKSLTSSSTNDALRVDYFVSRYSPKNAHIILVPGTKDGTESAVNVLGGIVSFLKSQPQVEDVSWTGSWAHSPSDVDKWASDGLSGGTITFLVMLVITILLGLLCFIYYKKNGRYPPMSLSTISDLFPSNLPSMPSFPSMTMPNINMNLPGRRGSTQAGGRTFGFARFSNERVSTVNIERSAADSTTGGGGGGAVERGETVDDTIQIIDSSSIVEEEDDGKIIQVSSDAGFTNVTYDLMGASDNGNNPPQQQGMEMMNKAVLSQELATASPPPPKPIRIGTGTLDLQALVDAAAGRTTADDDDPVYSEVVDALKEGDTSEILIPDINNEK